MWRRPKVIYHSLAERERDQSRNHLAGWLSLLFFRFPIYHWLRSLKCVLHACVSQFLNCHKTARHYSAWNTASPKMCVSDHFLLADIARFCLAVTSPVIARIRAGQRSVLLAMVQWMWLLPAFDRPKINTWHMAHRTGSPAWFYKPDESKFSHQPPPPVEAVDKRMPVRGRLTVSRWPESLRWLDKHAL